MNDHDVEDEIIPLVPKFDRRVGTMDTHQLPYIIEAGERAAEALVPYLRQLIAAAPSLRETPDELLPSPSYRETSH